MAKKISYNNFINFMLKNGYSEDESKHLFAAIKSMDKETRKWVIEWFDGKGFPKKKIEGITVEYLVKNYGLKPINAFIVIDWLKADPQAAKYFMLKIVPPEMTIDEDTAAEMRSVLKKKNYQQEAEQEDISDIVE